MNTNDNFRSLTEEEKLIIKVFELFKLNIENIDDIKIKLSCEQEKYSKIIFCKKNLKTLIEISDNLIRIHKETGLLNGIKISNYIRIEKYWILVSEYKQKENYDVFNKKYTLENEFYSNNEIRILYLIQAYENLEQNDKINSYFLNEIYKIVSNTEYKNTKKAIIEMIKKEILKSDESYLETPEKNNLSKSEFQKYINTIKRNLRKKKSEHLNEILESFHIY